MKLSQACGRHPVDCLLSDYYLTHKSMGDIQDVLLCAVCFQDVGSHCFPQLLVHPNCNKCIWLYLVLLCFNTAHLLPAMFPDTESGS